VRIGWACDARISSDLGPLDAKPERLRTATSDSINAEEMTQSVEEGIKL